LFSLVLLTVSFAFALSRRSLSIPVILLHIVAQVFMLYGITTFVQEVPRFAIGWKLAGIIDYIMDTGVVDGQIDAFFNWPGFFILMATITELTGFASPILFMNWAPVIFNLLYLGPVWMLYRSSSSDLRLVWLGLWFFYLANWIGQDYLAPQAFSYYLYLMVLALITTWIRGPSWRPYRLWLGVRLRLTRFSALLDKIEITVEDMWDKYEHPVMPATPGQRAALVGILAIGMAVLVASHQLTPFAALGAITALVLFNRCAARTLPILLGVLIVTYVFYMAAPYISGHLRHVSGAVGTVSSNLDANLTGRFRGSPGHLFVNYMRIVMTLGVWGLAFLGGLRRFRLGHRDWSLLLLALAPFPLLLLQTYGGELLLRIYLFSAPFMAYFGAALFYPKVTAGRSPRNAMLIGVTSVALLIGFLFTRYGNERMMYFEPGEVAAMEYLYDHAEPHSQFVSMTGTLPWRFEGYRAYTYTTIPRLARTADIATLVGVMSSQRFPISYLILTRSQQASGELFIGWPPGTWEAFEAALHKSGRFRVVYSNPNASVYVLDTALD
jgi:hypothetical protein